MLLDTSPLAPPVNDSGPGILRASTAVSASDAAETEGGGQLVEAGGRARVIFERGDADFTRSRILALDPATGGPSQPLLGDAPPLQLSPSFAGGHLYFVGAASMTGPAQLYRAPYDGVRAGTPQPVDGLEGLGPISWPRIQPLGTGFVAAYRDQWSRPKLAWSEDGARFHTFPGTVEPAGAAMVQLGIMRDGMLAMTYQINDERGYTSYLRLSKNGHTWSPRQPITAASDNVHDTTMVQRRDGGLDLYYVFTTSTEGFALYRRSLDQQGTLGPEQRVTVAEGLDINKPVVTRRSDGSVQLSFAEVTARGQGGWVTGQTMRTTRIDSDAPAPA